MILAYSWARPAILVAGKGRGTEGGWEGVIYSVSSLSFIHVPLSSLSLSSIVAEILLFLFYFSTTRRKKNTTIILFSIYCHSLISQQNIQISVFLYTLRQDTTARATPSRTWSTITMRSHIRRYTSVGTSPSDHSTKYSPFATSISSNVSPISFSPDTKWPTRVDVSLNPNSIQYF